MAAITKTKGQPSKLRRAARLLTGFSLFTFASALFVDTVAPFPTERLRGVEYGAPVVGSHVRAHVNTNTSEPFAALEDHSPWVPIVVMHGVEPNFHRAGIVGTVQRWLESGARGGRSIAAEVVELVHRDRVLHGGPFDAWYVWQLERVLSRNEVLEEWLDRTSFGGARPGLLAGARYWFGCHSRDLTLGQAALLVALSDPDQRLALHLGRTTAIELRDGALDVLLERGAIDAVVAEAARSEPLGLIDRQALALRPAGRTDAVAAR